MHVGEGKLLFLHGCMQKRHAQDEIANLQSTLVEEPGSCGLASTQAFTYLVQCCDSTAVLLLKSERLASLCI